MRLALTLASSVRGCTFVSRRAASKSRTAPATAAMPIRRPRSFRFGISVACSIFVFLTEKNEPEKCAEEKHDTWVKEHQRDHFRLEARVHQYAPGNEGENHADRQAEQPGREEGTHNTYR